MSCTNPSLIKVILDPSTGSLMYHFLGNARFTDPSDYGDYNSLSERGYFYIPVPCRHCLSCKIDYSRSWANRLCIELQDMQKAVFVTLTYNNENVPYVDPFRRIFDPIDNVMTLDKRHVQLFFKRLRKHFPDRKIRYYLCGEYGPKNKRPHYHAIIFGLDLSDFADLSMIGENELHDPYFTSPLFESIWNKGFVLLGQVNYKTCAYVARYVLKKHYQKDFHDLHGAIPEFTLCSRRPGIGCLRYQDILDKGMTHLTFATSDGVHTIPIPSSILRKGKNDECYVDFCNSMIYNRVNESNARLKAEVIWSEKDFNSFLISEQKRLRESMKLVPERK